MIKLSAVVTCFNNQYSIGQCLDSLKIADEIIVLDSFSTDDTLSILQQHNCTIRQQKFKGYWQQKQDAINLAQYEWVILLDSDEFLDQQAQQLILDWKKSQPNADAYALPRHEWIFWQWSHRWVKKNSFVRLFKPSLAKVSQNLVHESIQTTGTLKPLDAIIKHYSALSITTKLEKINHYSQLSAQQKFTHGQRVSPLKLIFYPPVYFFKQYILRRQIFNGWAGFINAALNSRYAFLKYAKLYELQRKKSE